MVVIQLCVFFLTCKTHTGAAPAPVRGVAGNGLHEGLACFCVAPSMLQVTRRCYKHCSKIHSTLSHKADRTPQALGKEATAELLGAIQAHLAKCSCQSNMCHALRIRSSRKVHPIQVFQSLYGARHVPSSTRLRKPRAGHTEALQRYLPATRESAWLACPRRPGCIAAMQTASGRASVAGGLAPARGTAVVRCVLRTQSLPSGRRMACRAESGESPNAVKEAEVRGAWRSRCLCAASRIFVTHASAAGSRRRRSAPALAKVVKCIRRRGRSSWKRAFAGARSRSPRGARAAHRGMQVARAAQAWPSGSKGSCSLRDG